MAKKLFYKDIQVVKVRSFYQIFIDKLKLNYYHFGSKKEAEDKCKEIIDALNKKLEER